MGKCLLDIGIYVHGVDGFHHDPPDAYSWGEASPRALPSASALRQPPVSFHHNSVENMHTLAMASEVWTAMGDGRVRAFDFSRLVFQEFDAFLPSEGRSVMLLFGHR